MFRASLIRVGAPFASLLPLTMACSANDKPSDPIVYAGSTSTNGGTPSESGGTSNGGSTTTSGGDSSSNGGTAQSGGMANSMGGDATSGGAATSGGEVGAGGASSGGASPTSGGATSTGGGKATTGGSSTGGSSTGGTTTGGSSSGGKASGGSSTGGTTTGGTAGATATGGAATGGAATGGASTGGSATTCTTACLAHRYTFDGTGTVATDSVGTANGTVMNTTLGGTDLVLSGTTSDQYVSLPADVLTGMTGATFEVWVTWTGGAAWQRIFDFGSNDAATAGNQGAGQTYLFLSPKAVSNTGKLRVAYTIAGNSMETLIDAPAALATATLTHLAVVVDPTGGSLALYQNGASVGSATLASSMSAVTSANNWIGRSQFSADPEFAGTIHEFRIYAGARTSAQIQASYTAGPNTPPTQ